MTRPALPDDLAAMRVGEDPSGAPLLTRQSRAHTYGP